MIDKKHTITAIATADGLGALAIIRISGPEAYNIFEKCIKEKSRFFNSNEKCINIYTVINDDILIDEVTAIKYKAPKSFTGEDMIEIICHGGRISKKEIIKVLSKYGAKIAQRGEFTKRAFENGKIDILKAESIRGIIESTSLIENRNALSTYYGKNLSEIEHIKTKTIEILVDIESEIEFAEEDDIKSLQDSSNKIKELKSLIENDIEKHKKIKEVGKGIKVIIAGPPNAGKSSLYNRLLGYERSIINEEAGTTRDIITEKIEINKKDITIIDSAGIRITENIIEKEGIKKSESEIKSASLIIWITAANEKETEEEVKKIEYLKNKRTIFIINKNDTKCEIKENYFINQKINYIKISLNEDKINTIENEIIKNINEINNSIKINDFIINERHEEIIDCVYNRICKGIENWGNKEIAAFYLNEAIKEIENMTGKISSEEVINSIFDKFCIGK